MTAEGRTARERLVYSAAQLIREQGVSATGVREVIARSGTPRGSFGHYFPGGKDQLIGAALTWSGDFAVGWVAAYAGTTASPTPGGLFAHLVQPWQQEFSARGFQRGCPVMATAADLAATDSTVVDDVRRTLARWELAIHDELVRAGVSEGEPATQLTHVMLSSLEGAIMLARVKRDVRPLQDVVEALPPLLNAAVDSV